MLSIYIKSALRQLSRRKLYTLINLAGLATGLTTMLLALLFWHHERSFDKFHRQHQQIFRITTTLRENKDSEIITVGATGQVQGAAFAGSIPGIRSYTRVMGGDIFSNIVVNSSTFRIRPLFVDDNFLSTFTFPPLSGNASSALSNRNAIVITKSTALRLFNSVDATGKMITMEADPSYEKLGEPLIVSAVVEDPPGNSSLQFDALLPFSFMELSFTDNAWLNAYLGTFLTLDPSANPTLIEKQMMEVYKVRAKEQLSANLNTYHYDPEITYKLQPLSDIHLNPLARSTGNAEAGVINGSNPLYSRLFLAIAAFILLMASINFVNISIAAALRRSKEVGVRKVSGGSRLQIIWQFLTESSIVCLSAFSLSIFFLYLLLQPMSDFAGAVIHWNTPFMIVAAVSFIGLLLLITLATGLYPAFIMARFNAADVLYGRQRHLNNRFFGKLLIVVQFAPAIFLLVCALIYRQQMNHIQSLDPGYNSAQVIRTSIYGDRDYASIATFLKNELSKEPSILAVSFGNTGYPFHLQSNNRSFEAVHKTVDENYIPLMELPVITGSNISAGPASQNAALVNETFVKEAGLAYPIGAMINLGEYYGNEQKVIVGVVKDHHHQSPRKKIAPMILFKPTQQEGEMWVKLDKSRMKEGIAALESVYKKAMPIALFEFSFLDELSARDFAMENKWQLVVDAGTVISLFICCLGLFGLAHITTWQRVKEIGIRKVLGATVVQVVMLLCSRFVLLVTISFVIAVPAAVLIMQEWLNNFAYRISPGPVAVITAAIISLSAILVATFFQSLKAAMSNAAQSIKTE